MVSVRRHLPSPSKTYDSVHAVGENSKSLPQITMVERRPYQKHIVKLLFSEQTSIMRESGTTFTSHRNASHPEPASQSQPGRASHPEPASQSSVTLACHTKLSRTRLAFDQRTRQGIVKDYLEQASQTQPSRASHLEQASQSQPSRASHPEPI